MRLALYTFGIFAKPADHTDNDGFHALNDRVLATIEKSSGFIARSGYKDDPGPDSWGEETYPEFYVESGDGWCPATLSLWQDLESAMAASYFGIHKQALSQGRKWFMTPKWPPYALWWSDDDVTPTWGLAVQKHAHLHENGPDQSVFNFKHPFDGAGSPVKIDQTRVKKLVSA